MYLLDGCLMSRRPWVFSQCTSGFGNASTSHSSMTSGRSVTRTTSDLVLIMGPTVIQRFFLLIFIRKKGRKHNIPEVLEIRVWIKNQMSAPLKKERDGSLKHHPHRAIKPLKRPNKTPLVLFTSAQLFVRTSICVSKPLLTEIKKSIPRHDQNFANQRSPAIKNGLTLNVDSVSSAGARWYSIVRRASVISHVVSVHGGQVQGTSVNGRRWKHNNTNDRCCLRNEKKKKRFVKTNGVAFKSHNFLVHFWMMHGYEPGS